MGVSTPRYLAQERLAGGEVGEACHVRQAPARLPTKFTRTGTGRLEILQDGITPYLQSIYEFRQWLTPEGACTAKRTAMNQHLPGDHEIWPVQRRRERHLTGTPALEHGEGV
ncbi:hypothetical protein [Methylobacterium segetis]|uniref:hypothetical protein n=1 Tax=Methylobacterium segetis TaxID=2488750 RepID=UPI00247A2EBE|nr:hypothetical protein [Methylobacterium segetis]